MPDENDMTLAMLAKFSAFEWVSVMGTILCVTALLAVGYSKLVTADEGLVAADVAYQAVQSALVTDVAYLQTDVEVIKSDGKNRDKQLDRIEAALIRLEMR